ILPLSSDFCFHFVFDPVPLFPLTCVYRWLPILPIPGSATTYYVIWVVTVEWNGCAYAACFVHRHQVVVPPGCPGRFSYRARLAFIGVLVILSSFAAPCI
ncbi:hypothetical protein PMAYCL1PPCAC_32848, partial [Pristionchus mayeri]